MAKKEKKNITQVRNSPELKALVDKSLNEIDAMTNVLIKAEVEPAEARLKVQQAFFKNVEMAGDPKAMAQYVLAELKTRIDLDRIINPEGSLVSEKYIELLDQMRKTIKLNKDTEDKNVTHKVTVQDDTAMRAPKFIDVEEE